MFAPPIKKMPDNAGHLSCCFIEFLRKQETNVNIDEIGKRN